MPSSDTYDLDVIDRAFGQDADLYHDVLGVSYLASDGEIQSAFFDRRSELFAVLSKLSEESSDDDEILLSQRRFAERRMDAVVMCFRILKDPNLRGMYEGERGRRISRRSGDYNPSKQSPTAVQSFDESILSGSTREGSESQRESIVLEDSPPRKFKARQPLRDDSPSQQSTLPRQEYPSKEVVPPPPPPRVVKKKLSKREMIVHQASPPQMYQTIPERVVVEITPPREKRKQKIIKSPDSSKRSIQRGRRPYREPRDPVTNDDDLLEEQSIVSIRSRSVGGTVLDTIKELKVVRTITEEVHGAYIDTVSAFDQVLNAFTLNESDICAVVGRIDKAKKQLSSPTPLQRE